MQLNKEQLVQIKEIELQMLSEIDCICKLLHIDYYLLGGTLLGAIRHQGFIPWDDDIDIGMFRDDYELFVSKAGSLLPEGLFMQNYRTDDNMIFPFTKIRNSNTTYIEGRSRYSKMNQGVWIDVFPLDNYENNKLKRSLNRFRIKLINLRIGEEEFYEKKETTYWHKITKIMMTKLVHFKYPKLKDAVCKIDHIYSSTKYSDYIVNNCGAYSEKEVLPRSWFGDGAEVEFNSHIYIAPSKYDLYLKHFYGNYMVLPPVEKRVSVHDIYIVDLEKSYLNYIETI